MGAWDVNKLGWVVTPFSSHGGAWPRSRHDFSLTRVSAGRGGTVRMRGWGGQHGVRGPHSPGRADPPLAPPMELARARTHLSCSTLIACRDLTPRDLNTDSTLVSLAGNIHPKERQSQGAASPTQLHAVPPELSMAHLRNLQGRSRTGREHGATGQAAWPGLSPTVPRTEGKASQQQNTEAWGRPPVISEKGDRPSIASIRQETAKANLTLQTPSWNLRVTVPHPQAHPTWGPLPLAV